MGIVAVGIVAVGVVAGTVVGIVADVDTVDVDMEDGGVGGREWVAWMHFLLRHHRLNNKVG